MCNPSSQRDPFGFVVLKDDPDVSSQRRRSVAL